MGGQVGGPVGGGRGALVAFKPRQLEPVNLGVAPLPLSRKTRGG